MTVFGTARSVRLTCWAVVLSLASCKPPVGPSAAPSPSPSPTGKPFATALENLALDRKSVV